MEPIYKSDETKRIRTEVGNPLLKVEFNPISMKWEVSEPVHYYDEYSIPESWISDWIEKPSSFGFIYLTNSLEYYSVCGTYDYWGQHVYDDILSRRPECREGKEIINEIQEFNDKVDQKAEDDMEERRKYALKEIDRHALRPVIYFTSKAS